MNKKISKRKIYVSGHTGMVGSAIVRFLKKKNTEIVTKKRKLFKKNSNKNKNTLKKFKKKQNQ